MVIRLRGEGEELVLEEEEEVSAPKYEVSLFRAQTEHHGLKSDGNIFIDAYL